MREFTFNRDTKETKISIKINLDGSGKYKIDTGIAFFDHMLQQISTHSLIDLELRCDGASWHSSQVVRETLLLMNIQITFHQSTTMSKNIIPELDVKIKTYSRFLVQLVEEATISIEACCHAAAAKCNSIIGVSGNTPAELFVGRGWRSNKLTQVNTEEILKDMVRRREGRRMYEERKALKKQQKKELDLVPYKEKELNSPLVNNPEVVRIKVGDVVTLNVPIDKNEPRTAYDVLEIDFKITYYLLQK